MLVLLSCTLAHSCLYGCSARNRRESGRDEEKAAVYNISRVSGSLLATEIFHLMLLGKVSHRSVHMQRVKNDAPHFDIQRHKVISQRCGLEKGWNHIHFCIHTYRDSDLLTGGKDTSFYFWHVFQIILQSLLETILCKNFNLQAVPSFFWPLNTFCPFRGHSLNTYGSCCSYYCPSM